MNRLCVVRQRPIPYFGNYSLFTIHYNLKGHKKRKNSTMKDSILFTARYNGICHDRRGLRTSVRGSSLKDAGRLTFAAAKMYPPSEASCEAGSMRGARRSSPGFSNQSARRHRNGGNTTRARRRKICDNCDASKGEGFGIICA